MTKMVLSNTRSIVVFRRIFLILFQYIAGNRRRRIPAVTRVKQKMCKTCADTYQTLSPVRRTFVFLGSRCTQPLTPRNAHALRYEFSKWRTSQRKKKTKRFCNEYSTYTLVRKANPRKKDTKLYDTEIDMILNRYRKPVSNLLRSAFNCLPPRSLAFLTAF